MDDTMILTTIQFVQYWCMIHTYLKHKKDNSWSVFNPYSWTPMLYKKKGELVVHHQFITHQLRRYSVPCIHMCTPIQLTRSPRIPILASSLSNNHGTYKYKVFGLFLDYYHYYFADFVHYALSGDTLMSNELANEMQYCNSLCPRMHLFFCCLLIYYGYCLT